MPETNETFKRGVLEASNKIWNARDKLTHNQIDEILFELCFLQHEHDKKLMIEGIEKERKNETDPYRDSFEKGYNAGLDKAKEIIKAQ